MKYLAGDVLSILLDDFSSSSSSVLLITITSQIRIMSSEPVVPVTRVLAIASHVGTPLLQYVHHARG